MNRKIIIKVFSILLICLITVAMGHASDSATKEHVSDSATKDHESDSETNLTLKALKGTQITDLYIIFDDKNLSKADRVKITIYYVNASKKYINNYVNIPIINGTSVISFTNLDHNETLFIKVTIGNGKSKMEMSGRTTVKLRPDLTVRSINTPPTALNTSYFNVDVSVTELNKDTGANFTLLIKEGESILASNISYAAPGGSISISIPVLINQPGIHNLSAVIANSDPAEDSLANNQQNFSVEVIKLSLNPADYTTWYYSQIDDYHNSKNLNSAADGGTHIEVSDYTEKKISEKFYYKLTINKELIFPIDSLNIQLSDESDIMEEYQNTNIIPTKIENGNTIATIYYPSMGSTLTITSTSGLTEVKLEKRARYQEKVSSGYNYYSSLENNTGNSNLVSQNGTLINSRVKTSVFIELIDGGIGYGGIGTMNMTPPVYSNSTWNDVGISGHRYIATIYTKKTGRTSI